MLPSVSVEDVVNLFDHIPEVCFFVKDRQGRFVRVNRALLDRLGLQDESEIVGTTDRDRYPPEIAEQLLEGDQRVMETGEPLVNHVEVLLDGTGKLDWFSTTKLPLRSRQGKILGVVGIVRNHEGGRRLAASYSVVGEVVDCIRDDPARYRVADLAARVGVSARHLNRLFHDALGIDVQQFLIRTRIRASTVALRETDRSIAEIGDEFGFCDQSAFTKQFRKHTGVTPAAYRSRTRERS